MRVDVRGAVLIIVTHKLALVSLESTEQRAILTLSFEHYSLKSLDKILQEEH